MPVTGALATKLEINNILTLGMQSFRVGTGTNHPDRRPGTPNRQSPSAGTLDPLRRKRMSVETALEQMLQLIHRRALNLAALPEDERDIHYDLIRLSCCRAAEQIGQSPDKAAVTANNMVEFTRAMVGIIDAGRADPAGHVHRREANAGRAAFAVQRAGS
jgi:hypothetical protein